MTFDLECTPSLVSAEDRLTLDEIADELEQPGLSMQRRSELRQAIADIAEKYTCDPRLAGY